MGAPFKLSNLVHQTSTTTGTGNFTLATVSGKQTFDQAYGHGATTDVFEYFIASQSNAEWEHGTGHMSSSTVLVRDTVWDSSNAGSLVSFSAATMDVTSAIGALGLWCPRGYIDGLTLSNDGGTPNTKLDVSAGICRDDTDAMAIRLTSSVVIDCTTTGPNGLDAGSLGVSTAPRRPRSPRPAQRLRRCPRGTSINGASAPSRRTGPFTSWRSARMATSSFGASPSTT
jgi:hypothetical protein